MVSKYIIHILYLYIYIYISKHAAWWGYFVFLAKNVSSYPALSLISCFGDVCTCEKTYNLFSH